MILITGVTGHVGRRVAEILSQQGASLRLMGRDLTKFPKLPNAEQVRADYADTASLDQAMSGIERAFIVSGHSEPGQRAREHRNAIQAAKRAGVKHIVYTSFQGAAPDSKFPYSRDHYETEQYLKESGVPFTALRDSMYMDMLAEMPDERGVIRGPCRKRQGRFCLAGRCRPGSHGVADHAQSNHRNPRYHRSRIHHNFRSSGAAFRYRRTKLAF